MWVDVEIQASLKKNVWSKCLVLIILLKCFSDEVISHIMLVEQMKRDPNSNEARSHLDEIPSIESAIQQARQHFNDANYMAAIDLLARPVELCPWDAELHQLRASCYELVGDFAKAILDIRPTTKLIPDNTAGYLKLSTLLYSQGYAEDSLK